MSSLFRAYPKYAGSIPAGGKVLNQIRIYLYHNNSCHISLAFFKFNFLLFFNV
jgi:hypothetical protein